MKNHGNNRAVITLTQISNVLWLIVIALLFPFYCFSQGENNIWYFGNRAGVDFNSGSPVALTNCSSSWSDDIYYETVSISDSLGNLLFYANYKQVFDRTHNPMPNGGSLATYGTSNQPLFAVKKMDSDSSYYLFAEDEFQSSSNPDAKGLTYSIIDMRLHGGLGDIVAGQKNIQIFSAAQTGRVISGTRHHNNHDVWVVVRKYLNSTLYLAYRITATGIDTLPVLSNSLLLCNPLTDYQVSGIRFSPDGKKIFCLYSHVGEMCDFNSQTGIITPLFKFTFSNGSGYCGAEFSIDSKYLYIHVDTNGAYIGNIRQYDATQIDSTHFKQSEVYIANDYGNNDIRLAPDGKLYITDDRMRGAPPFGVDSLAVINYPSAQGLACDYQVNAFSLNGRVSYSGFPQFLQRYYLYIHHSGQCQRKEVSFSSTLWPPADSIHWDFGDPASGAGNFSNLPNPTHIYNNTGSYVVELFVRHIDNRTDTAWQTITVLPSPQPNLGLDKTICQGDSILLDAGACSGCTYVWDNLTAGLMNIANTQTYFAKTSGNFRVTETNSNGCTGRDTVLVTLTPVPQVINNPLSKSICSGESTNIPLTSNVPGATFNWTASLTSGNITGFSPDSGLVINQILVNTLAAPGIVTYHITPKVGSCVGSTVDFPITVNPGDSVKVSISASINNICAGTLVTFTATPTNGGIPTYQWKVNGLTVGSNSPNYTYSPINGDIVSCILTSSITVCISNNPATSNTIQMIVNPLNPVSVSISSSANPVCAGTSVIFTAMPTNGGVSPSYQWKVNGVIVGTNNPIYSYTPVNGDIVTCILTSNILCPTGNPATSNTITMTVNPNLPVSVSITASANPFCQGSSVTFTAVPTNGGLIPFYQWKVNGISVGPNNPVYSYSPNNGDVITCVLTSNISCPIGNPANSNPITMIVNANLPAGISITASTNPFCPGNSVTFTATPVNGGTIPSYQWKVNGGNAGTNSSIFTYNPISGDLVSCILTSNLACVTGNPATSNIIIMSGTLASVVTFTLCNDSITTTNAKPFKLKGGIPLGGTYSGAGVSGGIVNPAIAGVGNHQINYSYTNAALCSATAHSFLHIFNPSNLPCGSPLTDIRDNKIYPTVQIGSQCWMAANLNYGTMIAGNTSQRDNCSPEKYCYNDVTANCGTQTYYQWDEIMQYDETVSTQGFCPPGWHVPTEADWNTLFAHFISNGFAGSPLKYSGFSGFNAILSGARHLNKNWDYQGFATFFWSSTSHGTNKAWAHGMNDFDPSVSIYPSYRSNAFSVRCVHD